MTACGGDLAVAPERADAAPGDTLQFGVTGRNASDIVEHYAVEMLGRPDGATVRAGRPVQPPSPAGTYVVGALVRRPAR